MAKNTYAKRLDAARAAREYAIRRYTRQQMLDFVTIALGRMGYGEKRLKDFEKMLSAVYIEFAKAFTEARGEKTYLGRHIDESLYAMAR